MASLRSARRYHSAVVSDLDGLRRLAGDTRLLEIRRPAVSGWSVGQHVDHLAVSDELILAGLRRVLETEPGAGAGAEAGPGPNLLARVCLLTGWIPRGRGRAPKAVLPGERVDPESLAARLGELGEGLRSLEPDLPRLSASSIREPHPVLGRLRPVEWLRFLQVHHRHHLKIVPRHPPRLRRLRRSPAQPEPAARRSASRRSPSSMPRKTQPWSGMTAYQ